MKSKVANFATHCSVIVWACAAGIWSVHGYRQVFSGISHDASGTPNMMLAKAWKKWRAAFTRGLPPAAPAPQPAASRPLKADAPFPPPGADQPKSDAMTSPEPEPEQAPALGASALLDAWKVRESALIHPPDLPKPDRSPFPQSPGPAQPSAPVASEPRRNAAFAPWLVAIAAAAGIGGWLWLNTTEPSDPPGSERPNTVRPEPAQTASVPLVMCPLEPVVPVAGDKDGRFPMQTDVSGLTAVDGASFVILSSEASAAGRARDAEVGLLMSCRIADKLKGAASVESADAKYRLGLHYANLSLRQGPVAAANRAAWLERAQILLADSLLTYSTRYGDSHDKSRFAANALASVRQHLAQKAQPESAPPGLPGGNGAAGSAKLPTPTPTPTPTPAPAPKPSTPSVAAKPPASPLPAIEAREKARQTPPAIKECPPAVATLGLCDSP